MGRHREFDLEETLEAALHVFWQKGFEGTSLTDLATATGVAVPGLYSAFGNKEAFFLKVTDHYEAKYLVFMAESLLESTVRAVIETLLRSNVKLLAGRSHPPGCLGVNGALACSDAAEPIREELGRRRKNGEVALCRRFRQARTEGGLPDGFSPEDLARYVMTISQGMAVQAKAGATLRQLNRVVDLALLAIPE
jgi:AcrR family transcriptional regulator